MISDPLYKTIIIIEREREKKAMFAIQNIKLFSCKDKLEIYIIYAHLLSEDKP